MSAGLIPANVMSTNQLLGPVPQPLLATMSAGGAVGTNTNPGFGGIDTMNISANGGSGPGPVNDDLGKNSGVSNQIVGSMPASGLATASPPNFGG
jgi:hypothetical protein